MKLRLILFCTLVAGVSAFPKFATKDDELPCGYSNCPKPDSKKLNIHIVPHSHDDVGWLKTVDQYYYGSKNNIQKAGVQYILDSVVEALLQNSERRFIYVETAFFWKWWQEKSEEVRNQFRGLVENGQLEITGGGWSMNDEAAVHYQSTIDQFTLGFKKLSETLGRCAQPKVGWQIDPFGHSREMASLFAQFGFDGVFFARLDWRDKSRRLSTGTAEMIWNGSQNLGESSQLFTSVLYNHYSAPPGFCFDVLCNDDPIIDNKKSTEYNSEKKAEEFLRFAETQSRYYRTNNIIITMGDDFNYQDAISYFGNLDRLIKAVNALETNTTIFYSSPSCYLKAINEANIKWPVKTDDFFPYASDPHAYWNGYFTSRPTSKRFERLANNFLQISKQLASFVLIHNINQSIEPLKEAVGIMQHHDAITGTEKQHVADDYARIVSEAIHLAVSETAKPYQPCLLLNVSQCEYTERREKVDFLVYNPLSRTVSQYIRIPVSPGTYKITHEGNTLLSQMVPIFDMIKNTPGRKSSATHEIVFRAENLPPLGFKRYNLTKTSSNMDTSSTKPKPTKKYKLNFQNGILNSVGDFKINQNFFYYRAAVGNNAEFKNRSSGAYIFRPETNIPFVVSPKADLEVVDGPIVTEYHQTFSKWVGQIIRVYEEENHVEFNWIVGPIPLNDNDGKEVVNMFSSDLKTDGVFYTDSNGREMIKRQRSYRETFNLTHEEPIAENYYPVTAKITLKDEITNEQMSVLNDRAQGGSSIQDGQIELMVHRRLLRDDAFGVGEALNENAFGNGVVAAGKHYLVFGKNTDDNKIVAVEKELAPRLLMEPQAYFFSSDNYGERKTRLTKTNENNVPGLTKSLPPNVQILTLEPWKNDVILLRLEHIFEKGEDPKLSLPVTVDLKDLFVVYELLDITETSLGANHDINEISRLKWTSTANEIHKDTSTNDEDPYSITLEPMQIRTFLITITGKKQN